MFKVRLRRAYGESLGCLRAQGPTSVGGAVAPCREAMRVFTGPRWDSSSLVSRTLICSSDPTTVPEGSVDPFLGPRNMCRIGVLAVVQWRSLNIAGNVQPFILS